MEIKNLKQMKEEFNKNGVFYTPLELSEYVKSFFSADITEVYDPTSGCGSLLSVFPDNVVKYGQELDPNGIEYSKGVINNFIGYSGDTLKDPKWIDKKFDVIVANPPFSIKWDPWDDSDPRSSSCPTIPTPGKADYAFILHILYYLSNKGKAVIINFPGILYRSGREGIIRKWIIENNWVEEVISIPANTFVDTSIETVILILNKNKNNTDIKFSIKDSDCEYIASIEDVKFNKYDLSISKYLPKIIVKEVIDPIKLELDCRAGFIRKMNAELQVSTFASNAEGLDINVFIDEIIETAEKFRN